MTLVLFRFMRGLAGGADIILIPEIPFTIEGILKKVHARAERGSHFSIIVVSEGCQFEGKQVVKGRIRETPIILTALAVLVKYWQQRSRRLVI